MMFTLFSQVQLTENLPQFSLKKGSFGTVVEHYSMPENKEDGYSIEGLISQNTVEVSESQIAITADNAKLQKVGSLVL